MRIYTLLLVGMARCAVRAAFSGATRTSKGLCLKGNHSARYYAGEDIAARCPCQFKNARVDAPF